MARYFRLTVRVDRQIQEFAVSIDKFFSVGIPSHSDKINGSEYISMAFYKTERKANEAKEMAIGFYRMQGYNQVEMNLTF